MTPTPQNSIFGVSQHLSVLQLLTSRCLKCQLCFVCLICLKTLSAAWWWPFFHIEWPDQIGKLQKLTEIFKNLTPKYGFLSFFSNKKENGRNFFLLKKTYIIILRYFVGGQNVALLISLHAGGSASVDTTELMREPPKRPGAKRRQRCQDEAWKIFGRLMQQVGKHMETGKWYPP